MLGGLNIGSVFNLFSGLMERNERRKEEDAIKQAKKKEAIAELDAKRDETLSDWYLATGASTGQTTSFMPQVSKAHERGVKKVLGIKSYV